MEKAVKHAPARAPRALYSEAENSLQGCYKVLASATVTTPLVSLAETTVYTLGQIQTRSELEHAPALEIVGTSNIEFRRLWLTEAIADDAAPLVAPRHVARSRASLTFLLLLLLLRAAL